jgi:hypothetical protein
MNTSTVTIKGKPSHGNARRSSPLVDERVTHAAHCPPTPPSPDDYSLRDLDAAERDMQVVLDAHPALTPSGFTVNPRPNAIPHRYREPTLPSDKEGANYGRSEKTQHE